MTVFPSEVSIVMVQDSIRNDGEEQPNKSLQLSP